VVKITRFWRLQFGGWVAYSLLSFPLKYILFGDPVVTVLASFDRDVTGFLLTCGKRALYNKIDRRRIRLARIAVIVVVVSVAVAVLETFLSIDVLRIFDVAERKVSTGILAFGVFYFRVVLFLFWSVLYFGIKLGFESIERDLRLARAEASQSKEELRALKAQVNPHFLFNALNTIWTELGSQQLSLRNLVHSLSDYLRYSLAHRNEDYVSLGEEFDLVTDYLAVEKVRFRTKLEVSTRIEEAARELPVPVMTLQPLVENAIKHGLETSTPVLTIRLRVICPEPGIAEIEVANTGAWVEPKSRTGEPGGVGLENLKRRLALIYGDRHTFEITVEHGWVIVLVRIETKAP
jgi:LytS/YehU family sensor histidine kinase